MVRAYEKDARIARILFFAGCAFLPWVWILLLLRYRADLVAKAPYAPGQEQLKKYLVRSAAGLCIVTALFIAWVTVFQTTWQSWGSNLLVYTPDSRWWLTG